MKENNFNVLSQCKHGKIFKCHTCDKIHIEYKNFYFSFNDKEYESFKNFFVKFNNKCTCKSTQNKLCKGRFKISMGHSNLAALFSHSEIDELKSLLKQYGTQATIYELKVAESIEYKFSNN